jgi:hypothetical protein
VIAKSVEVKGIHQQFYAAIATATPILLLALLVLVVRREAAISFATRQESIVTEARIEALKEETIKMIENARELVEAEPDDDGAPLEPVDPERDLVRADRRNHIISGLENAEDRVTRMQEAFEQLPPERVGWKELAVTMGIACGAPLEPRPGTPEQLRSRTSYPSPALGRKDRLRGGNFASILGYRYGDSNPGFRTENLIWRLRPFAVVICFTC